MGKALEDERRSIPAASFKAIGDTFVGMVVDRAEVAWYEYRSDGTQGPQKISKADKPQTQEMLTCLVLAGTTCHVGGAPAVEGTVARLYIKGHNRYTPGRSDCYGIAKDAHGPLCVGDVIRERYIADEQGQGAQPKHVHDFAFRKPKPEEAELEAKAEAEHDALHRRALDGSPAGGPAASAPDMDESDF